MKDSLNLSAGNQSSDVHPPSKLEDLDFSDSSSPDIQSTSDYPSIYWNSRFSLLDRNLHFLISYISSRKKSTWKENSIDSYQSKLTTFLSILQDFLGVLKVYKSYFLGLLKRKAMVERLCDVCSKKIDKHCLYVDNKNLEGISVRNRETLDRLLLAFISNINNLTSILLHLNSEHSKLKNESNMATGLTAGSMGDICLPLERLKSFFQIFFILKNEDLVEESLRFFAGKEFVFLDLSIVEQVKKSINSHFFSCILFLYYESFLESLRNIERCLNTIINSLLNV